MERRLLHIFLALVCVVTQAMAMTGSGTAADPYLISSAADLVTFRDTYINNNANTAACAKLTADIDLSTVCSAALGTNWHSIGVTYPYTGTFDGDGHTVSNLYIKMTGTVDATVGGAGGLFHHVSGTVKNVKIKDPYIYKDMAQGGPDAIVLCSVLNEGGLIDNCSVDGGTFYTVASTCSGMVCYNYGTIKNCTNNSDYSGMGEVQGGIVANNCSTGVVSSCVNNANMRISSGGQQAIGGIAGYNNGTVEYCINNGEIHNEFYNIGGIVNENYGIVRNCLNTGNFRYDKNYANIGAIVYSNKSTGTVTNCYYRDDIKVYKGTTLQTVTLNGYYQNLNTSATPDTHSLTSAQCTSGEAAWLLNGSTASVTTWKQLLGTDANPSPLGTYTVYYANNTYSNSVIDASGTYLIYNAVDLKLFADKVNATTDNAGLNAKLMADIDLSSICGANVGTGGTNWTPIANIAAGYRYDGIQYSGTFDGNGKTISGLYIKASSVNNALFCYVGASATVKNLTVDANINGKYYCAAIAAFNFYGTISGCTAKGTIVSTGYSGGIASYNQGTIEHCANEAKVTSSYSEKIGGITGENPGTINYSVNRGIIENTGRLGTKTGGIAGYNNGTISNSYNLADVTSKGYVGGIVGYHSFGSVTNCYNTADVTSTGSATTISTTYASTTGAIVGYAESNYNHTLTNCHYLSTITLKRSDKDTTLVGVGTGGTYEANTYAQTLADFNSGKIARLLNGGNGTTESATSVWGQNLATTGRDAYPVMMTDGNANAVYCASVNDVKTYCNTGKVITIPAATTSYVDEKIRTGAYKDAGGNVVSGSRTVTADMTLSQSVDNMASHKSNADSYYEISTPVQMKWLSYYVNASSAHATTNARLMADIDLSSVCSATAGNWTPIGNSYTISYKGTFDGNGKAISNLYIANATTEIQGLFGYISKYGVIKDLSVSGKITSTTRNVGLLTGYNDYGQIIHCISSGSASGSSYVGGITGQQGGGSITQCVNKAELSSDQNIGGITAFCHYASITDCLNEGTVKVGKNDNKTTAGIVGYTVFGSTIKNCLNMGKVYVADVLTEDYPILGSDQNTESPSTLTNNYYLNTLNGTAVTNATAKTADELQTGTVARLLNGGDGTTENPLGSWGQNLATTGGDAHPVMMTDGNANAVYCASVNGVKTYGNTGKVITLPVASFADEKIYTGDYKDAADKVVTSPYTIAAADVTLSQTLSDDMAQHTETIDGKTYYQISTAVQMKWLSYYVNASSAHAATNAQLINNIDLSSVCSATAGDWTPIGNSYTISYKGTFDGNGKAISNLYIANATTDNQGLFGYARNNVIKNLSVSGNITSTATNVGLLTGYSNSGQIIHCISSGSASGSMYVGGIAGSNEYGGSITQCVNKAELSSTSGIIGGITANCNGSSVTDCLNEGTVKAGNNDYKRTAGIVGYTYNGCTIKNCLNMGKVYVADVLTEDYPILGIDQDATNPSTLTNNYYLNTKGGTAVTNATAKTADELKTGTVARLLNGGDGTTENPLGSWGQDLATTGGDAHPVMMTDGNANAVYCASVNGVKTYGNTGKVITLPATSFADEKIYTGDYKDAADKVVTSPYTIAAADVTLSQTLSDDMAQHTETIDGKTYYQISTAVQMKWLSYYVNASSDHAATNARLMNNIDLSSVCSATAGNWTPIGNETINYSGTFDGNGKAISNLLYMGNSTTETIGLFGQTHNSVIKNLSVSGKITSNARFVGLLAGYNAGQIIHCISSGSARSDVVVGGIAGYNKEGSITQCVNKAELSSTTDIIGGITGLCNGASVTNCLNEGTVKAGNNNGKSTAGIVGETANTNTIKNCLNMGKVYVADVLTEDYPILGIDDDAASTLTNNYYLNTLNGTATYGTAKTADELKTGTVARLLNGGDGTTENPLGVWGQNLATTGGDAYPVMMTNGNANAVYAAMVYNGSSLTAKSYMNLSYTAPTDNKMTVLADAGIDKNLLPANVITAENTARRIVITDGKDFYLPADVTADSASYSRSAFRDGYHETICIPFAPAALPADYSFSAYTSKDDANTTAYFSTVTALNAGESYMMKYTATATDTKADVTFENNGGNVTVLASPVGSDFIGSYVTFPLPYSTYILGVYDVSGTKTEKFRHATDTYKPAPFRAYLELDTRTAKEMQIVFDNETTGIGAATPNPSLLTPNSTDFFNLQGMKVNAPQQNGIYIHNGKKVVFRRK